MTDQDEEATQPTPFSVWLTTMGAALGYSRDTDLARGLGIPQPTISRWRTGSRPSIEHLWKISRLFGAELEPLLVLARHIPEAREGDPLTSPPEPVYALSESVRRIRDADLTEDMKQVLFSYWNDRLKEERQRLYTFISEFSGPPRTSPDAEEWLVKAFRTELPAHAVHAFMQLVGLQVGRLEEARRAGRNTSTPRRRSDVGTSRAAGAEESSQEEEAADPPQR